MCSVCLLIYVSAGIHRECSELEIKKAYRRESLKHHPDKVGPRILIVFLLQPYTKISRSKQGGDEEKFKLVVEAHGVLSDPRRRERYDMGEDEDGTSDSGMGGMGGMNQMDLAELFAQFHGGGGFSGFSSGGPGGHSHGRPF